MHSQPVLLKVRCLDGSTIQAIGRTAAMVMWLVIHADQVNDTFRGTITFDWEGPSLRPHFARKFDRINTDTLMPLSDQSTT